jgi:hypothetical protein
MVPGGDELMGAPLENDSHLRAVRRNTPYETEDQYMDTYYRLLRADCFAAIQKVPYRYVRNQNAKIIGIQNILCRIVFDADTVR